MSGAYMEQLLGSCFEVSKMEYVFDGNLKGYGFAEGSSMVSFCVEDLAAVVNRTFVAARAE